MSKSPEGGAKQQWARERWKRCAQLREKSLTLRQESVQLREVLHRLLTQQEKLRENIDRFQEQTQDCS